MVSQPPRSGRDRATGMAKSWRVRVDDSGGAIRERLEAYELQTRPVLEFYRAKPWPVIEVDRGPRPPEIDLREDLQADGGG